MVLMDLDSATVASLRQGLEDLAGLLRDLRTSSAVDGHDELEAERGSIVGTIDDYLLPRMTTIDPSMVAVIAGPGGTGKSTLVNSLAQAPISETGVIRPTTTAAVLWSGGERTDAAWDALIGAMRERFGPEVDLVEREDPLTAYLTIVDTPPVDHGTGHAVALDMLTLADICVFVTSPARYADAAGWDFVHTARLRGVPTLFVLNRLPADEGQSESLIRDLASRLHERDLLVDTDPGYIFGVPEAEASLSGGLLDPEDVAAVWAELAELADAGFRGAVMAQIVLTTTVALAERASALADAFVAEGDVVTSLRRSAVKVYEEEAARLADDLAAGLLADVAERASWAEAASDLASIVTRRAGVAAQRVAAMWADDKAGAVALERNGQMLWRHDEGTADAVAEALEPLPEETGGLARDRTARRLPRGRATRRVADRLWRLALDPQRARSRGVRRRYGDDLDGLVGSVRERITDILVERMLRDGDRFAVHLSAHNTPDVPGAVADAAERVLVMARSAITASADA